MLGRQGFYVTPRLAIFILVLFVMIVLSVGLMAGFIPERHGNDRDDDISSNPDVMGYYGDRDVLDDAVGGVMAGRSEDQPWLDPFLPKNLDPQEFTMWFYPDFYYDASTFYGRETIKIEILEDTKFLIVHYKMMEMTQTSVKSADGVTLEIERAFGYDENQFWVVEMKELMRQGLVVELTLEFTGSLTNGIVGYYKSTYINANTGIESWLATTKFQPADARKAFPNFDEPAFKSKFTITLKHWKNFTALSNMPVDSSRELQDGFMETTFQQTPLMSSYLTCFIVTDFAYKENWFGTAEKNITHRVWAAPDRIDQVDYALDISPRYMDYFREEFDMAFHLPKLDQVAVPDYPSGATEHWGLITYRESRLLYDPAQVGDSDKQGVARIVAHELAHNYFGNTVTCQFWDEIWLNEGSVNFYQNRPMDVYEPFYNMAGQFVVSTMQGVMRSDAGTSSRPMVVRISTPDQANAAFDGITYNKGASMFRMMENFMGPAVFKVGIRGYLATHNYGSVTTEDLIAALQVAVNDASLGLNMTAIMDPWFRQMGLPVINIREDGNNLVAEQRRFLNDPDGNPDEPESPYRYKWWVPLSYRTRDGTVDSTWLRGGDESFPNPAKAGEWIKFNNDMTGYYRVNYPENLWQLLANQLSSNFETFNEAERSNLIDDAFNLARAGQLNYNFALGLTTYLSNEQSYVPWRSTRSSLDYIGQTLYGVPDYGLWRSYITEISSNLMNKLEVSDGGTHMEKLNRLDMIRLACGHGHTPCLQNTTRLFLFWLQNETTNAVPTNIRRVVYQYGMEQTGQDSVWNTVWDRYTRATSGQEKGNLLWALSRSNRVWLINRLLEFAKDESKIRSQDFFTLINYLSANPNANALTWDWVRRNYDYLIDRFGVDNRYLGWMVPNVVSDYSSEFKLREVEEFYARYPNAGPGASSRATSLASIRANISWRERSEEIIITWLKENVGNVGGKKR